jgi:hypothetical protein
MNSSYELPIGVSNNTRASFRQTYPFECYPFISHLVCTHPGQNRFNPESRNKAKNKINTILEGESPCTFCRGSPSNHGKTLRNPPAPLLGGCPESQVLFCQIPLSEVLLKDFTYLVVDLPSFPRARAQASVSEGTGLRSKSFTHTGGSPRRPNHFFSFRAKNNEKRETDWVFFWFSLLVVSGARFGIQNGGPKIDF